MRVADLMLDILAAHGVRHVFGVPGDAINDLTFGIEKRDDLDFVLVRHEEAGAFAASAQAKLTGNLACCMGTAGGGAIHLLNGLYDAKMDNAPLIAITGQVATEYLGTEYHQEVDLERLFSDVAVYSKTVMSEDQLPGVMLEACKAALSRRGVAHINIPTNVSGRSMKPERCDFQLGEVVGAVQPSDGAIEKAAAILNSADKVAILAGIGAADAGSQLVEVAELLNAPIARTLRAKDWIDDPHPLCIGGLGLLGGAPASRAMEECDALLIVGANYPYVSFLPQKAKVVHIDRDAQRLAKRISTHAPLHGDSALTLSALKARLTAKSDRSFLDKALKRVEDQRSSWEKSEQSDTSPVRPQRLMASIAKAARDNAIFLCDTGTSTAWTARHLPIKPSQRYTLSAALGTMAFAMPGALGAQLAFPDRQVVAIAGDGGFAMLMADLVTATKYDLPIKTVILNNSKLGFIALEQEGKGLPEHSIELENPDFVRVAEACGAFGVRVDAAAELDDALTQAFAHDGPAVIDVVVSPDELIMPPKITLDQAYQFGIAKVRETLG